MLSWDANMVILDLLIFLSFSVFSSVWVLVSQQHPETPATLDSDSGFHWGECLFSSLNGAQSTREMHAAQGPAEERAVNAKAGGVPQMGHQVTR